ncbi:MAG: diguanylate cyclase [Pseudodesulfovibrio sp.]
MRSTGQWTRFFSAHGDWLAQRVLARAKEEGYVKYTSLLIESWRAFAAGLSESLLRYMDACETGDPGLSPADPPDQDPYAGFVVREARLHRSRGVDLPLLLVMFKHCRRSYLDLLREKAGTTENPGDCSDALGRFFDRAEIALCADWVLAGAEGRLAEMQRRNRLMTTEKNRFLTLFESLVTPVFLLDDDLNVEAMNRSAADYLGRIDDPGDLRYARRRAEDRETSDDRRIALKAVAPWLAAPLEDTCSRSCGVVGCRVEVTGPTALGPRHFKVSVARMADISPVFSGLTVVLDDITQLEEIRGQLEGERNRAARYLDVIGSILLGLDASANITLINKVGKAVLGRAGEELLGRNWIDLAVPEEERYRVREYFREVFEGRVSPEEEYVNQVVAQNGERKIISWRNRLLRNEAGLSVGVLCAGNDITARVTAEEKLRERERIYRALFENNHAVMLLVDPKNGAIRDANPAAAKFYGYPVEDLRTMNIADINTQSEVEIFKEMTEARAERRSCFLFRHKLASGEIRDVEVYSGPVLVRGRQLLYSLVHDVTRRMRLEREMERMATTDALTGADNRHQFFRRARAELARAGRYGHPLTALMLDIDHFKDINDTYGHQAGDTILRTLVNLAVATLREADLFGRLGGEEFAAILPETDVAAGLRAAERLRRAVEELEVPDAGGGRIRFTVSIGVAGFGGSHEDVDMLIRRADDALYRAKGQGRNRVEKG